tara:strand:+ start:3513 stop:4226 length:714 start_codon:yes stop_codon:yes gene_type:complete
MAESTQNLVEGYDYNTVAIDSSNAINIGGSGLGVYWSDFTVQVSQNLYLEKRSNNFLVINGGKTFITWSNEECRWVEYKINSLEKKFKKNLKRKECKPFRDDSSGFNVMDILICQEGNYYVDLKNSLYYIFSDGFWNSLDLIGELFIDIEKPTSLKHIKNKKNEKTLLVEKMKFLTNFKEEGFLSAGYVYSPYAVNTISDNVLYEGGAGFSNNTISSRYAINNINTDYYTSIDITSL